MPAADLDTRPLLIGKSDSCMYTSLFTVLTINYNSGGAIGIENIKSRCRVSDYQLDTEIPTKDLHILAECFDNYKDFLDKLLLSPSV